MPSPRPRRRRRPWALLGVTAAAAAAAALAIAAAYHRPAPAGASGKAPVSASPRRPAPTEAASRAPSPKSSSSVPAVSTAGWRDASVDGAPVPVSAADGPSRTAGGLASGFTDTPAGAVLAGVNIAVRTSGQLGPDVFAPTIAQQVTGSGEAALLAAAWRQYGQATQQATPARSGGAAGPATSAVTSFLLAAWSPAQAAVVLTVSAGSGTQEQLAIPLHLQWLGGDWRLVAPSNGTFTVSAAAEPVPSGYTPLPGA